MKNIEVSFLAIQPLEIQEDTYEQILLEKISFNKIDSHMITKDSDVKIEWLNKYQAKKDPYRLLREVDLTYVSINHLREDLKISSKTLVNGSNDRLELNLFLNELKTKYALYYDVRFSYFILVYEIHFSFPCDILNAFLNYVETEENGNSIDLYNTVRNLIVKEDDNFQLGNWGNNIQKNYT